MSSIHTVSALDSQSISLVRRNNEWHHFDPLGTAQVITNGSAQVVSNNVYDLFGVLRYQQGSAQTPWRWQWIQRGEEGLAIAVNGAFYLPDRIVVPQHSFWDNFCPFREGGPYPRSMCDNFVAGCLTQAQDEYRKCKDLEDVLAACGVVSVTCSILPPPLSLFCGVVGAGCGIASYIKPSCGDIFAGKISFCLICWEICLRNSYRDNMKR
jgi:hypothetical protein